MSDGCPHCRRLAEENAQLAEKYTQARELNLALTTEHHEVLLEKSALKGKLAKVEQSSVTAEDIGYLLDLWLDLCATPRQRAIASIAIDGTRGKIARAALKSLTKGRREQRRDRCADAIRGKSLRPYLSFGQWYPADGKGRVWANDVEHALGSEKRIEEHAAFWEHVQSKPVEWRERQWQQAALVEQHYQSVYFDLWLNPEAVADREALVEPGLSVLPGTSVEIPQPKEKRPRLFVVPDPESEAA
jgi:hypothetical protein